MIANREKISWTELTKKLAEQFKSRAIDHDHSGNFVHKNYKQLKEHNYFSAMIPIELGGAGVSHAAMCDCIRIIGRSCGSTALALSMHQHLIAASLWKYYQDGSNKTMLKNVANHELILVSTGARDWLESNGQLKKTKGGYLFSAKKHFASQSVAGDLIVTSGVHNTLKKENLVLHFAVPTDAMGITLLDDWDVMGMRSTGSRTLVFDNVFIPDSAITLERLQGEYHNVWNVVLPVAMPLIMSAYVGIAEEAFRLATATVKGNSRNQGHVNYIIGKAYNTRIMAKTQWLSMITSANNLGFNPSNKLSMDILSLKTNVADACIATVGQCMDAIGGQSFYRKKGMGRLFRDVQAAKFHPLPKWDQYAFTGEMILNNNK